MKKILTLFVAALALFLTTAASAQTIHMKADIPFTFILNGATLPSGEYFVNSMDLRGQVLSISNSNSHHSNLIMSNSCHSLKAAAKTKLVFHRYGDRYFLKQIWVAGNDSGRELATSR
jgi:hypothetical protein